MEQKSWEETDRKALSFVRIYWLAMGEVHYCSQTLSTAGIKRSAFMCQQRPQSCVRLTSTASCETVCCFKPSQIYPYNLHFKLRQ